MASLDRARGLLLDVLDGIADPAVRDFVRRVLEQVERIVANEREGITFALADDLAAARSVLHRLRIPGAAPPASIPDPSYGELIDALDISLAHGASLQPGPRQSEMDGVRIDRKEIIGPLTRLGNSLVDAECSFEELGKLVVFWNRIEDRNVVEMHLHVLPTQIAAARLETMLPETDLAVLARCLDLIREILVDLRHAIRWAKDMAMAVRAAAQKVLDQGALLWRRWRAVTRAVQRRLKRRRRTPPGDGLIRTEPLPSA